MNALKFSGGGYSASGQRDLKIDLVKGMGILLMVFRHTEAPYSEFVLLFHMALFFIASGYLFNPEKISDLKALKKYIIKKIKGLWIPYFGFMAAFVLLHNLFLKLSIITDDTRYLAEYTGRYAMLSEHYSFVKIAKEIIKSALFRGNEQVGGALWFFYTLFLLMIGYAVIGYVFRKICGDRKIITCFQGIVSVVFLVIGFYLHIHGKSVYGLNRFFSFYCLIFAGQVMRGRLDAIYKRIHPTILFLITLVVLVGLRPFGYIDLSGNNIENPAYFVTVSLAGWFMMYSLAVILEQLRFKGNEGITYLSIHSVPIIGMHFLAFKLVSWVAIRITGMGNYMLAAFPVLMHGAWWVAYFLIGIAIPLAVNKIYVSCRKRVTTKLLSK